MGSRDTTERSRRAKLNEGTDKDLFTKTQRDTQVARGGVKEGQVNATRLAQKKEQERPENTMSTNKTGNFRTRAALN